MEVPVKSLQRVKKGEVLFKIDPVPFQAVVDSTEAQLAKARNAVPQLKANLDSMLAAVVQAKANRDRAKDEFERFRTGNENAKSRGRPPPFTEADVERRRLDLAAAEAAVVQAEAIAQQARLAYESEIDGVNTTVARFEAELRRNKFNLEQTAVRAPYDGYLIGVTLRPGQLVAQLPLCSWLAFAPIDGSRIVMAIPQTRLRHVKSGQPAEVTFAYMPGQIFGATTEGVIPMNSSGQLPPSGILPSLRKLHAQNEQVGVLLRIDDAKLVLDTLPRGSDGTAAVYTESAQLTHVIRRIMMRMDAWLNYIRPN